MHKAAFDALLFPLDHHERGPDPGPFIRCSRYRPHLRREFKRKCVYCRISDGWQVIFFEIDHYLPQSKFPHLVAAWPNLFYACQACNRWKGSFVSTPELFLPNPCDHRMADHLQYRGSDLETYTPHGAWLAELLYLDAPERRELREFTLDTLRGLLEDREELIGNLIAYEARLKKSRNKEKAALLRSDIRSISNELKKIERHIERIVGEPVRQLQEIRTRPS